MRQLLCDCGLQLIGMPLMRDLRCGGESPLVCWRRQLTDRDRLWNRLDLERVAWANCSLRRVCSEDLYTRLEYRSELR